MRNGQDDTNGTLERLNDALSALEGRIGIARQPSRPGSDFSAIRARQAALNPHPPSHYNAGPANQMGMPAEQQGLPMGALQAELRQLRTDLEREMAGNVSAGFDAVRTDLMAMQKSANQINSAAGNGAARELRSDIAALKADVARLAREDTLQGLVERWSVIEREISDLPKNLGSREELLAVSDRLDNVQHAISSLPQDHRLDGIENQVRTLALALEQIAAQGEAGHMPMANLDGKFAELGRAIAAIPAASEENTVDPASIDRIEARISAISRMLENDEAATSADKLDEHFSGLANRLNMIQEETANLRSHTATAFPKEAFDRLEERIDDVAGKIEQVAAPGVMPTFDAQFAEITNRLATLQEETSSLKSQGSSGIPSDVIDALGARIEQLGTTIGSRDDAGSPQNFDEVLSELNDRLVYVIDKVNSNSDVAQETAQSLIESLDTRMDEIARRIDENENRSAAVPSLDTLEGRLEDIAQMLASGGTAEGGGPAVSLTGLEAQVAELTQSLSGGSGPIDQENLMSAARAAADEAVARLGAGGSEPLNADLERLTGDLKSLETLARDSDDRNSRTFEAIHDTLLKVVDHLSNLEGTINTHADPLGQIDGMQAMAAAAPKPAATQMAPPRMELPEAPSMVPQEDTPIAPVLDDEGLNPAEFEQSIPRQKLSPAEAAAAAAQAAVKDGNGPVRPKTISEPSPDEGEAPSKSILKGMAKRLRGEAPAGVKAMAVENQLDEELPEDDGLAIQVEDASIEFDEPIEPGSGGADLGEIMRRVREERAGGPPASVAPSGETPSVEAPAQQKDDSGKSDFIAAARRAAKAAAADATVVSRKDAGKKSSGMSSLGGMLATRRKPILMGAGAILLALLSLPLLRGYLAPSEDISQVELQEPAAAVESTIAPAGSEIEQPVEDLSIDTEAALVEPDIVEEANLLPEQATTVTEEALAIAPTPAIDPVETSAAEPNIEISIDDIPAEVGTIALREAAASGNAKALYVVADYFTGGVPNQSQNDLGQALSWYEKSAQLGYAPAQYRTGSFYEKGLGGTRDLEAAKTWYQTGAEQGNAAAMHNLAVLYANGIDGTPDMVSATRWFKRAAELGLKDSQFNLGILSAKGEGVPQDLVESYKWFAVAARTGDPDAATKRDEVAEALQPEQLETAKGAADLWKVKPIDEEANIVSIPDEWIADQSATSSTAAPAPAPQLDAAQMKKAVQNIQAILNNNGYDAGPVDGVMGGKTREAIIAFQESNGLVPNGEVNQALVTKLIELNEKNKEG